MVNRVRAPISPAMPGGGTGHHLFRRCTAYGTFEAPKSWSARTQRCGKSAVCAIAHEEFTAELGNSAGQSISAEVRQHLENGGGYWRPGSHIVRHPAYQWNAPPRLYVTSLVESRKRWPQASPGWSKHRRLPVPAIEGHIIGHRGASWTIRGSTLTARYDRRLHTKFQNGDLDSFAGNRISRRSRVPRRLN